MSIVAVGTIGYDTVETRHGMTTAGDASIDLAL
jgi:hypothetical protein